MSTPPTIDVKAIFDQILPLITAFLSVFIAFYLIKMLMGTFKEIGAIA